MSNYSSTFEKRRNRRITALNLTILTVFSLGILRLLVVLFESGLLGESFDDWAISVIKDEVPKGAEIWLEKHIDITALGIGFLIIATLLKSIVSSKGTALYIEYFEEFDRELFIPAPKPLPLDPLRGVIASSNEDFISLPWIEPKENELYKKWQYLKDFIGAKTTPGFKWVIITGGAGIGKTRLALEILSYFSHDHQYRPVQPEGLWKKKLFFIKQHWLSPLNSWWHIRVKKQQPRAQDKWDVGVINKQYLGTSIQHPIGICAEVISKEQEKKVDEWFPRRPSILLLDDPKYGESFRIIQSIKNQSQHYKYPVRLVIVNQTIPRNLAQNLDNQLNYLTLTNSIKFYPNDIYKRKSAFQFNRNYYPLSGDETINRFLSKTEGNPFLVELGINWLRNEKNKLSEFSKERLVEERVERIFTALKLADAGGLNHHQAIAVATLIDGCPKHEINDRFRVFELNPEDVQNIFPSYSLEYLREYIPPVSPRIFGDVFIRRVFQNASDKHRNELIECAWQLKPKQMLTSTLRLSIHDELSGCLAITPERLLSLPWKHVVLAFIEQAVLWPKGTLPESKSARAYTNLVETIKEMSVKLTDVDSEFCSDIVSLADKRLTINRIISEKNRIDLLSFFIPKAQPLTETQALGLLDFIIDTCSKESQGDISSMSFIHRKLKGILVGLYSRSSCNKVVSLLVQKEGLISGDLFEYQTLRNCLFEALEQQFPQWQSLYLLKDSRTASYFDDVSIIRKLLAFMTKNPDACIAQLKLLEKQQLLVKPNEKLKLEQVIALRYTLFALRNIKVAIKYFQLLDSIADYWPHDNEFQLERAIAWGYMTCWYNTDSGECLTCAQHVDSITPNWPNDFGIQLQRARAWSHVTYAHREDSDACLKYAQKVDSIAKNWHNDSDFQLEQAKAWRVLTDAYNEDSDACLKYAQKVDSIAKNWLNNYETQVQRLEAWRNVTFAHKEDSDACLKYAQKVDNIAENWPDGFSSQIIRARAWSHVTFEHKEDSDACLKYAQKVDNIAENWPDDNEFQLERATTWRNVTFAHKEDSDACLKYAQKVDSIAKDWHNDNEIQLQRAMTWRHVTFAHKEDSDACLKYAKKVYSIAERRPDNSDFQFERELAWHCINNDK